MKTDNLIIIAAAAAGLYFIARVAKGGAVFGSTQAAPTSTGSARVVAVKGDLAKLVLTSPVCTKEGEKVALSRRVEKHWRLIGWGSICAGVKLDLPARK